MVERFISVMTTPEIRNGRVEQPARRYSLVTPTSEKCLDTRLRPAEDQRVNIVRSLMGVDGFHVHHMSHYVVLVGDRYRREYRVRRGIYPALTRQESYVSAWK